MSVHISILIKKLDSISDNEFHQYWSEKHPKIWLSVPIVREKMVKYSQFHIDHPTSAALSSQGVPIAPFDGGANMWVRSLEDFMAVWVFLSLGSFPLPFHRPLVHAGGKDVCADRKRGKIIQDEEYNRVVVPDEETFLKRSEAVIMVGRDEDKWVDEGAKT